MSWKKLLVNMKNKIIVLSYKIDESIPMYGDTPRPKFIEHKSMEKGDSSNTHKIELYNHSGTHVDAPAHFIKGGKGINEYKIEELIFENVAVVEIEKQEGEIIGLNDVKKLKGNFDCILIKTGFCNKRNEEVYVKNNPGLSADAVEWIRTNLKSVKCIGLDTISITGFQNREEGREAHKKAFEKKEEFGEPLLLIEDMDLREVNKDSKIKEVRMISWNIEIKNGAPCIITAELE